VTVQLQGFRTTSRRLAVSAGSAFDIPISLELGTLDATVTVVAETPLLETARSQIAGTVPHAEIRSVPMNGRNFLDLALLVPGRVSRPPPTAPQLFAETSGHSGPGHLDRQPAQPVEQLHRRRAVGQRRRRPAWRAVAFGVDAIEQLQVVTGGGQAEFGRALGGYVNVVTRSGTNNRSGTVYGFFRDDLFNGKNALTGTDATDGPAAVRRRASGGPIALNRTFYFANSRTAGARSDRRHHDHTRQHRGDQRSPDADGLSGPAGGHRDLP
jgi:hypothetical protein